VGLSVGRPVPSGRWGARGRRGEAVVSQRARTAKRGAPEQGEQHNKTRSLHGRPHTMCPNNYPSYVLGCSALISREKKLERQLGIVQTRPTLLMKDIVKVQLCSSSCDWAANFVFRRRFCCTLG
jgi:hypothetical protein